MEGNAWHAVIRLETVSRIFCLIMDIKMPGPAK